MNKSIHLLTLSSLAALAIATPALAQQAAPAAPAAEPAEVPGDIVVTAQKRSERLVAVPLAVTAVSGASLANQQINDTASLTRAVPALSYQAGNGPGNSSFRIRGVGTQLFSYGVESAVAVVVDGVVAPRQVQGFADLADLQRVEVLRGPQGTLFGKNATAGVINIVTEAPTNHLTGHFDATVAEKGEYRVKGSVSGPLSENVKGRISAYYNDVGGFIYNANTGRNTNGSKSWGLRGKLEWDATSNLKIKLLADMNSTDADCCSRVPVKITTPAMQTLLGNISASPTNRTVSNDGNGYYRTTTNIVSLQGDLDLGKATVTSITAFQRFTDVDQFEPDQIASNPNRYVGAFAYSQWNDNFNHVAYNNWSQELRIGSNGNSDLTYVAGVFYNHINLNRYQSRRRLTCSSGASIGAACSGTVASQSAAMNGTYAGDNIAGFGQIDWRAIGGLHVIVGLREQYEAQKVTGANYGPINSSDVIFPGTVVSSGTTRRSGSALTGKAGLRYEFNRNLQAYASYTRGYKAFALDIDIGTNFATQTGLAPERVNAYELGLKWSAPGGLLDINTAIFRSDFTNLQVQALVTDVATGTFNTVLANAGKSRSQGFEVEATLRPVKGLSIGANFSYTDATIDVPGQSCPIQSQTGLSTYSSNTPSNTCYFKQTTTGGVTSTSSAIIDVVGGKLPATPAYRFGITPRYERDFGNLTGFIQMALNYQSSTIFALNQDPLLAQGAYALVDGSIGVHGPDNRWSATVFVRNMFNQNYYTQLNHGTLLANTTNSGDLWANFNKDSRRYFGATVGFRF
ncbi:iron complex outermembrane receptor protein [Novosphingobium sp. SG751A]|uniref:TonB-dependent receptor n=1 Tax=Novosphingobium sp. SG751A TaxID=2587000 RepID=UPI0015546D76|nr:TonB-dependent receptor [Novosphingobium sp. SG751A]NOW46732.1 iron complex outermembrane receptor protein [Novosphingobium sp. SG751A]